MVPLAEVRGARPARVQGLSSSFASTINFALVFVPSAGQQQHLHLFDCVRWLMPAGVASAACGALCLMVPG
eukprot:11154774-Lingulodinium_polyedra.AAC.1